MTEEYDPKKLWPIEVRTKRERYRCLDPLVSLNTASGNLSFNKKASEGLIVKGTKKLKIRFFCDGFKLYVDSIIEPENKNYLTITRAKVGCSMAVCLELIKHYNIKVGDRAVFDLIEVEKYRYRLELKKTEPLKKKGEKCK